MFTFDPGFGVTSAGTESKITYIDGDAGVLMHRGYPIEQLAEKSELHGSVLPAAVRRAAARSRSSATFIENIRRHTMLNESLLRFYNGFHHNAHPMAMVSAVIASMSAFYHDSMDIHNPRHREIFAHRIIAKMPDHCRGGAQAFTGPAVRLSAQRPELLRQHAAHVLRRALRAVSRRSGGRRGARPAVHPARGP